MTPFVLDFAGKAEAGMLVSGACPSHDIEAIASWEGLGVTWNIHLQRYPKWIWNAEDQRIGNSKGLFSLLTFQNEFLCFSVEDEEFVSKYPVFFILYLQYSESYSLSQRVKYLEKSINLDDGLKAASGKKCRKM